MEVHYLLLNQPVTLELVVGLLPARDVIHVALINGRDPPKLPVIPRVRLSAAGLHNRLPEPLDRLLEHGVKGPMKPPRVGWSCPIGFSSVSMVNKIVSCRSESS